MGRMNTMAFLIPTRCTTAFSRAHLVLPVMFALLLLPGCKKNTETDLRPGLNAANDNILVHRPFIHVFNMLMKASVDTALRTNHHAVIDKADVTWDPVTRRYKFEYQGDLCPDSVRRYGAFLAYVDSNIFIPGAKTTIRFLFYVEDVHQVKALDTIVNMGLQPGGRLLFRSRIDSVVIKKDTIRLIHWKGHLDHEVDPVIAWQWHLFNGVPLQFNDKPQTAGFSGLSVDS
jgi:hypothetical protein